MNEQDQSSIGGGWLGIYACKGSLRDQPPVRFEATLSELDSEGKFSGTILDDGALGEALVSGSQSGSGVRFSKSYRKHRKLTVSYEGTLSEDSRVMQGTWRIADDAHGVWDARRLWHTGETAERAEKAQEEVKRIREVVRLG